VASNRVLKLVLVGKPNVGKSSLFNKLTGLNQKIGNYSGVTVEIKSGRFKNFEVIDIPGLKSLDATSPEEVIAKKQILQFDPENAVVLFIANGTQLQDNLLLFSQIADLQLPMVLAINFKDELENNDITLDIEQLRLSLGCPVAFMNAKKGEGLEELATILETSAVSPPNTFCRSLYDEFTEGVYHNSYRQKIASENKFEFWQGEYNNRLKVIDAILKKSVNTQALHSHLKQTQFWDTILLHPIWGLLIFTGILFLMFQAVFSLSAYPMDWIDGGMAALSELCREQISIPWLQNFLADALLPGIGGVVIFIPQIAILFFLLGLLEQTGYLARISFISDAFLRKFGLSGHSVIPLMSSWACSIPAIMSTRIIANPKERLAVILASPLMTCSARLPVYTILIAVVFPNDGTGFWGAQGLALLSLYLLGVIATLSVSYMVNKRLKVAENPYWVLELPVFRMPNWNNIFITVYQKTKSFVVQAGKIILGISIVLWALSSQSPHNEAALNAFYEEQNSNNQTTNVLSEEAIHLEYSYLGYMGKMIEPTIAPLGYDWKIGIALLSSFAAREVFVGTLASVYSIGSEDEQTIVERLQTEVNPSTGEARFNWATSISLLLFYVFALQCMSTLAIVRKETGSWKYALFQFVFMLILAYGFAFLGYHLLK